MFRFARILCLLLFSSTVVAADNPSARDIVHQAMEHWRGLTSYGESTMVIHRPDWERTMTMRAWTRGDEETLVQVTAPKKDAGNGTLLKDNNMWSYTPRINRIIKIPSSMMNQNWMGSDFSNRDISKSTDIIDQYTHTLLETRESDGHRVYVVESVPHEDAAVVWGKEILTVRDDWVLIEHQFWDQDNILVKKLQAREIAEMSGRSVATVIRMFDLDTPDEWTEMRTISIEFDVDLPDWVFTLSNLRNPRS